MAAEKKHEHDHDHEDHEHLPIECTVEQPGPVTRLLRVAVAPEQVRTAFDTALTRVANRAKIDGFRKGKVPRHVVEKRYGEEVRKDVVQDLVERACGEAIRHHGLRPVANPSLVSQELADDGTLRFEARVEVRPEFVLGEYKGLEVERRIARVEDEHVSRALDSLRERMAVLLTEEERVNVQPGDVVQFDMYAFADGRPIDSASGQGIQLEVGSGRFPEEFERGIVGVTRGIQTPIDVRFPDDHRDQELAGKLVRFQVTVREIKNKILPKLDDEFAREVGYDDCDTLEKLREHVRKDLEAGAERDADRRVRNTLLARLVEAHQFEVPPTLVEQQIVDSLHDMGVQSLPPDKVDEVRTALEPGATRQVRAGFILDAIAAAEELKVEQEELESVVNRQMAGAGADAERVRSYYSNPAAVRSLYASMLRDKALTRATELSTRRDVVVDESQVADPGGSS